MHRWSDWCCTYEERGVRVEMFLGQAPEPAAIDADGLEARLRRAAQDLDWLADLRIWTPAGGGARGS
ncbi:MAG: hypothetical protein U5R48_11510 [Gammaproteobacteria bacterium]|nr:hypothetical protein [Gammaproteobacteria bacterium]